VNLLVTGATGGLGRDVVRAGLAAGHTVRIMSRRPAPAEVAPGARWATAHLVTGHGLARAVAEVDAIIHAASDPRGDRATDTEGTRRLAQAAIDAGVPHLVYVSIVGIDRIVLPYYEQKLAAERILAHSGAPYSILRATQFHSFIDVLLNGAARAMPLVMPLWAGFHIQSVAIEDVTARLLHAVVEGPRGMLPDFGGPERMSAGNAARLWKQARGVRKPIVPFPRFDAAGAGFRAGHNTLPADTPPENRGRLSWADWLARPVTPRSTRQSR
jgi:uncharacterized protein YbjT (DUF2867 family)